MSHDKKSDGATASRWPLTRFPGWLFPRSRYHIAGQIFVRGLGVVYLVAILSWWSQADGLVGEEGIAPASRSLASLHAYSEANERSPWMLQPSLFLLTDYSDTLLKGVCAAGALLAVLVIIGLCPGPFLLALWAIYLSLVNTGDIFMRYQWDMLLLETGLLGVLLAPWGFRIRTTPFYVSRAALFLIHLLLAKLMFFSGYVKLASEDAAWAARTALTYHYETQPLPTPLAWYAHQLPENLQRFSCQAMFGIELVLPFCIFLGRRFRSLAFAGFALLNGLIIVTGNYNYFNVLALLLCVTLLDDALWPRRIRRWFLVEGRDGRPAEPPAGPVSVRRIVFHEGIRLPMAAVILVMSAILVTLQLGDRDNETPSFWPPAVLDLYARATVFSSVNSYGLFAVMTTERPEIEIEGSDDGETWKPYVFKWKPGPLDRAPGWVAPHQPRLDWQMWFAALGYRYDARRHLWFRSFLTRLLEGAPGVMRLLKENPFPGEPPRYVRARLYQYTFTDWETRRRTGNWWAREEAGEFFPAVSTRNP